MSSSLKVEARREHNNTRIIAARHTEWENHNEILQHIVKDNNEGGANIKTIANIEINIVRGLLTHRSWGEWVNPAGTTHYIVHTTDGREHQWYVDVLDTVQAPGGQYYFIIDEPTWETLGTDISEEPPRTLQEPRRTPLKF